MVVPVFHRQLGVFRQGCGRSSRARHQSTQRVSSWGVGLGRGKCGPGGVAVCCGALWASTIRRKNSAFSSVVEIKRRPSPRRFDFSVSCLVVSFWWIQGYLPVSPCRVAWTHSAGEDDERTQRPSLFRIDVSGTQGGIRMNPAPF